MSGTAQCTARSVNEEREEMNDKPPFFVPLHHLREGGREFWSQVELGKWERDGGTVF